MNSVLIPKEPEKAPTPVPVLLLPYTYQIYEQIKKRHQLIEQTKNEIQLIVDTIFNNSEHAGKNLTIKGYTPTGIEFTTGAKSNKEGE